LHIGSLLSVTQTR